MNILLVCSAGMSTSILVEKMRKEAAARGLDASIDAIPESRLKEQSNVDVSAELTAMIESQTVYTANSKVFMTSNEMLDTLMNLKR